MAYDLKHAILEHKPKNVTPKRTQTPPSVNAAPNQPNAKDGGITDDDFEKQLNNQAKDPNSHSSSNASNNPKNNQTNDLNYKKNGLNNPNNDPNNINPTIHKNHTPFQRIFELAELLERYSLPTQWQQSFPCPCIASSGYPKPNCPICHGLGLAFKDPVTIGVAYQRDDRQYYNGKFGVNDIGETLATPQITENGIGNGISPRDRLSVDGLTISQTYIFNVSKNRINTGEFIPYHVRSIDLAVTMDNQTNDIVKLQEGKDYTFNYKTFVFHPKKQWIGHNISLLMTVSLRFYVTNVLKETRYATVKNLKAKKIILGENKPNKILTNYVRKYKRSMGPDEVYIRMPKYLVVKRENIILGNEDFDNTSNVKKRNHTYTHTKVQNDPNNPLRMFGV